MGEGPPLLVALTADVDADANRAAPGRPDAVSPTGEATYVACGEGLGILLELLGELRLPATFFWEARALERLAEREDALIERVRSGGPFENGCHGYEHEDFSGARGGVELDATETRGRIERAGRTFESVFGRAPRGFRAPYCRLTNALEAALAGLGYNYDSSRTRRPSSDWHLRPYRLEASGLWEVALCRTRDGRGSPISGYLWQLFEGNRPAEDYLDLLRSLRAKCPGGLLPIALHPWHIVLSADGIALPREGTDAPATRLRRLLTAARGLEGIRFTTPARHLAEV